MRISFSRIGCLLLAMGMLLLSSCVNLKNVSYRKQTEKQLQQILEEQASLQSIDSKLNLRFQSSSKIAGQIKIKQDSCLWLSIQPFLGIEAFRILITEQQLTAVNRLQKSYVDQSLRLDSVLRKWTDDEKIKIPDLSPKVNGDNNDYTKYILQSLNNLLLNRIFVPQKATANLKDFDISWNENGCILTPKGNGLHMEFVLDIQHRLLQTRIYTPYTQGPILVQYDAFQSIGAYTFPCQLSVSLVDFNNQSYWMQLDLVRPLINTPTDCSLVVSRQYKKTSIHQMLKDLP